MNREQAADFLYHEAELLDGRHLDEWLALWTDDALYWLPAEAEAPDRKVSLVYDDRARLGERVRRISSGFAYSQQPPSRTCHVIGNVRITDRGEDALRVASTCVVTEIRRGGQRLYSGPVEHLLVPDGDGWKIRRKVVRLVNGDTALGNLTFLL